MTNFEPNYLAAIEFYDEDFPWRYTPAPPDAAGARLSPWLVLAVFTEDEFDKSPSVASSRLPAVMLTDAALANAFPDPATLWAWAHVHVNRGLTADDVEIVATDRDAVAARLDADSQGKRGPRLLTHRVSPTARSGHDVPRNAASRV